VHEAGGLVWVDRAREGGAAFKIFLPALTEPALTEPALAEPADVVSNAAIAPLAPRAAPGATRLPDLPDGVACAS
jgi:hypothetical protein